MLLVEVDDGRGFVTVEYDDQNKISTTRGDAMVQALADNFTLRPGVTFDNND